MPAHARDHARDAREGGSRARRKVAGAPAQFATPSRVSEIQRQRILAAMAEVSSEHGVGHVTVAHIVARSGVSRRTFYELFRDREDCLLEALDQALARTSAVVLAAYERERSWSDRVRAALGALLGFFDEEPALARLCIVESLGAGPLALKRRTKVVRAMIAAIDEGRAGVKPDRQPPPLTAEGVVGAVLAVIHARLQAEAAPPALSSLAPSLMAMIVHPYLGQRASQRELVQAPPRARQRPRARRDPLEGLDMRLTYRTVRVLVAIASTPDASNRGVAAAAGIADQGQISKLLARLQSLGLIHNRGEGQPKGGPNAWALTPKGQEVERSIRMESASG
jgi:AcrR family transcriptional regulator